MCLKGGDLPVDPFNTPLLQQLVRTLTLPLHHSQNHECEALSLSLSASLSLSKGNKKASNQELTRLLHRALSVSRKPATNQPLLNNPGLQTYVDSESGKLMIMRRLLEICSVIRKVLHLRMCAAVRSDSTNAGILHTELISLAYP